MSRHIVLTTLLIFCVSATQTGCVFVSRSGFGSRVYPNPDSLALSEAAPPGGEPTLRARRSTPSVRLCVPEFAAPGPHYVVWTGDDLTEWGGLEPAQVEPLAQGAMVAAFARAGIGGQLEPDHCEFTGDGDAQVLRIAIVRLETSERREDPPSQSASVGIEARLGERVERFAGAVHVLGAGLPSEQLLAVAFDRAAQDLLRGWDWVEVSR